MTGFRAFVVLAGTIGALALTGCGRKTDFLYDAGKPEVVRLDSKVQSHQLVEMLGTNALDILWVIDNSGSMYHTQQSVIQNTSMFIQEFATKSTLDWRMSLISTDVADPPYLSMTPGSLLDFSSANPEGFFQAAVGQLGLDGSTTEMMYAPVLQALQNNPQFVRPNSDLAIIVATDEDEQSPMTTQQFLAQLTKIKPLNQVLSFGIFSDTSFGGCDGGAFDNPKYQEFISATGGKVYPLCAQNFGDTLSAIGNNLGSIVTQPVLALASRPVVGSIHVHYHGQEIPGGPKESGGFWRYDYGQNALVFHDTSFVVNFAGDIQVDYQTEVVVQSQT